MKTEKEIADFLTSIELLHTFRVVLAETSLFEAVHLETVLKDFVKSQDVKVRDIIHTLRMAVTGKTVGLGIYETLEILGQESSITRIDRYILLITGLQPCEVIFDYEYRMTRPGKFYLERCYIGVG